MADDSSVMSFDDGDSFSDGSSICSDLSSAYVAKREQHEVVQRGERAASSDG
jgi:hypothetical protein